MVLNVRVTDLTLRGQLSKIKMGYGDNLDWVNLNNKELKEDFYKTLGYYRENKEHLSKEENEYLNQLEEIERKVFKKES